MIGRTNAVNKAIVDEPIEITENGVVVCPDDKRYNPITVNVSSSGGDDEWQPNADMEWGKSVCENDVNTNDPSLDAYKIFQYVTDQYVYSEFELPAGCAIKTSDGAYYTNTGSSTITQKHTWTGENDHQSEVYDYKLRWVITYYPNANPTYTAKTFLVDVLYLCFDGVSISFSNGVFGHTSDRHQAKRHLEFFDLLNNANLDTSLTSTSEMFKYCESLLSIPFLNTDNITNMKGMFDSCISLTSIPLINTSNATILHMMFQSCTSLKTIPPLNTGNATITYRMFQSCTSLKTIPPLNTSNVTNMAYMFQGCTSLKTIPPLNTSNVTDMSYMFYNCYSLNMIPPLNTSNVTNMSSMFYNCYSLQTAIESDSRQVTNINSMYFNCYKLQFASFNMVKVTSSYNASNFLANCSYLEFLILTNIKVSITISSSTKYSTETLVDILHCLTNNNSSSTLTLTMGSVNLAKLTTEQQNIATLKNWQLK